MLTYLWQLASIPSLSRKIVTKLSQAVPTCFNKQFPDVSTLFRLFLKTSRPKVVRSWNYICASLWQLSHARNLCRILYSLNMEGSNPQEAMAWMNSSHPSGKIVGVKALDNWFYFFGKDDHRHANTDIWWVHPHIILEKKLPLAIKSPLIKSN